MKGQHSPGSPGRLLAMRVALGICLGGFLLTEALGQRAPDISRGTSAESVIQLYGWPKGKSVADGRESWLYETFQILFEDGRVVAVSYIAPSKPTPKVSIPSTRKVSPPPVATPLPKVAPSLPASSVRSSPPPASDYLMSAPTKAPRSVRSDPPPKSRSWEILVGVVGATALAGFGIVWIQQRTAARQLSDALLGAETSANPAPAQRWEDDVAARLAQANAGSDGGTGQVAGPARKPQVNQLTRELLRSLEWKRFEQLVALYFEATGVDARCTCIGADGGIDVKLHRRGEEAPYAYVQCKAWESEKIKLTTMREFLGVMAADDIAEGAFVTTSDFWPEARAFAEANDITVINGSDFLTRFASLPAEQQARIHAVVTEGDYTTPTCVKCDRKMQARARKKDGARFWGCRCGHALPARATT
jgi:hypothetical protein